MISDASFLNYFRLTPLEESLHTALAAAWTFIELDRDQRVIQFMDASVGQITNRKWDFGDGSSSNEKNPVHQYQKAGEWTVALSVEGPDGKDRRIKVWEIVTK
jgi:hypothetical protein